MPWKSSGALMQDYNAKIDAVSAQLARVTGQVEDLFGNVDRISSELKTLRERFDADITDRRDQSARLTALRTLVGELQAGGATTADALSALRDDHDRSGPVAAALRDRIERVADETADHAARLDALRDRDGQQERSLDQAQADIARMERQAAADLAELRSTDEALARLVLKKDDAGRAIDGAP